ncbi:MAG: UDP-N-acetylmuramoyl-L-alanine--D-glutamate ligase [Candidatus Microsaccharimonas sossegonensis]|uniref:UDP-N-acetylmuramoylalanine--D-glutamate ligase n=1 Tax=Candidatus Microsaccharimonas sossegonensis TaxID=2506948 RepID=A0A4Q0AHK0_9BACT|nr:MAG: UDP-N-acetylmuramoyl-L-alanine--D-glutamate ligase [Candidatus Microsaccharimonas sossegonensis]
MKIAIAGYGVEGEANYRYYSKDPSNDITIFDHNPDFVGPEGVRTIVGPDAFEALTDYDLVLRSPSIAPYSLHTHGKIWSGTNEFFATCPAHIIGVTGSKGKGTTASLIASVLKTAGRNVWLVGNIGVPALDVLNQIHPNDIVVYELSSFQLWDLEGAPKTAVVLCIEREHLDVHKDMAEYVAAKGNITRFQTSDDLLIYNDENEYSRSIAEDSQAQKVGYPSELTTHVRDGHFYNGEQKLCSTKVLQIKGPHNISNAIAAIDAVWQYTQDPAVIEKGLHDFTGLPHRLAFVRTVDGVDYYDDSIATTPASAIAALRAFDTPKVIILGGSSKGSDFTELADELIKHNVYALLIGDEAEKIAEAATSAGFHHYEIIEAPTMEKVVARARQLAKQHSVVLLSPASASFGLFKNYVDRGEQFIAAVNQL